MIASISDNGPITEGGSATITVLASDPAGTADPLAYEFDCDGDGTYEIVAQPSTVAACEFADDGARQVNAQVMDDDGGMAAGNTIVEVQNASPIVALGDDAQIDEGGTYADDGGFSDPGITDTWTATADYGDGDGPEPLALSDKLFAVAHRYLVAGSFTVTVCVRDDDGGEGCDSLRVTVNAVNAAPIADDQTVETNEDTSADITLIADDVDGDPLAFAIVTPPAHGTLHWTAPDLTYEPERDFSGADALTFLANDGASISMWGR